MKVTVYSKPTCHKCDLTKTQLTKLGVEFEEIDILENHEAAERFRSSGLKVMPIVEVIHSDGRETLWHDYRYSRIKELAVEWHK